MNEDDESAGNVFAEALRQWREALGRDPDASTSGPGTPAQDDTTGDDGYGSGA